MTRVGIIIGSDSDKEVMNEAGTYLDYFGIEWEMKVSSAHRMPEETANYAKNAAANGISVIIAAAGMAAHLPGVVAAFTDIPVIGVPLDASPLGGLDALYSIVQMPAGIPVGTVTIGKDGARNSAVLAARIIALQDENVRKKLEEFRKNKFKL